LLAMGPRDDGDAPMETDAGPSLKGVSGEEEKKKGGGVGYVEVQRKVSVLDEGALERAVALCKVDKGKLGEALEALLVLEKQCRIAADLEGTTKVCVAVVGVCWAARDLAQLNGHVVLLSKRRAQLRQAVTAYIQEVVRYLDDEELTRAERRELATTLSEVCEGKIYVEVERAKVVRLLASMKEADGDVRGAAELMQDVAVETFGSMDRRDKMDFILESVRLCLDVGENVKAFILAKKISPRTFTQDTEGELEDLKVRYYRLLIRYHSAEGNFVEMAMAHQQVFGCKAIQDDTAQWRDELDRICWFLILAPYDSPQQDLLHRVHAEKRLAEDACAPQRELVRLFTTRELINWEAFQVTFRDAMAGGSPVFAEEATCQARREALRLRVVEHNLLVVGKYYRRVTLSRLAELIALDVAGVEKHLAELVVAGKLQAKIDRPAGVVRFSSRADTAEDVLNRWSGNVGKLLDLVEVTCHKIHREMVVHRLKAKA